MADLSKVPGYETRVRTTPSPEHVGRVIATWSSTHPIDRETENPKVIVDNRGSVRAALYGGKQETVSRNNPKWQERLGHSGVGGDFFSQRTFVSCGMHGQTIQCVTDHDQWRRTAVQYRGPVIAYQVPASQPPAAPMGHTNNSLDAWGAKAIAICKPTNSLADLSTFLGELRKEGLPSLSASRNWEGSVDRARKAPGDDYLNIEFGWKPIVNEVRSFAAALADARRAIKQYERDAGRVVRRGFEFEPITAQTTSLIGSNRRAVLGAATGCMFMPAVGRVRLTYTTVIRRWFEGAFTYHLPVGYVSRNKVVGFGSQASKLLGLELTPDVLWNLSPWSWAVDWFSSTGDVISNLTDWATDGLVMRWGYVMEHTLQTRTYSFEGHTGYAGNPPASPVHVVTETKRRVKANPFGFGITWSGLTPRQLAITAALGISRS